jgi:hypothetical protein
MWSTVFSDFGVAQLPFTPEKAQPSQVCLRYGATTQIVEQRFVLHKNQEETKIAETEERRFGRAGHVGRV